MSIARYSKPSSPALNPWSEFDSLMNRVMGSRYGVTNGRSEFMPPVNVREDGDQLVLEAELPGMSEEDIDIEFENNVLTIRGEKTHEREEHEGERFHVWERQYGSFLRSFTLPRTVRGDEVNASFENGILTVTMPKTPEAKGRKITIGTPTSVSR